MSGYQVVIVFVDNIDKLITLKTMTTRFLMKVFGIVILFVLTSFLKVEACRFTVREIGFSILSQDIFTLAIIDENADPNANLWKEFHAKNRDCNLRLEILNPVSDSEHPIVINAKQKGFKFPRTVLVAPNGSMYSFDENDISKIYSEILDSPLNVKMRSVLPDVFAAVIWVEGEDVEKNRIAQNKVQQECDAIKNIMPGMPKIVKEGPVEIVVSKNNFQNEKLLLWSLGIDRIPDEPIAFVLYGRGRIIGVALNYQQILEGGLYKYMSMIGADCECGLDKKWMLGNQIPLLWNKESRQYLAKLVGFDVDNPMILAEMSRILAKETLADATGSIAFAPETIDLDEVFGNTSSAVKIQEIPLPKNKSNKILFYTLLSLLFGLLIIAAIMYYRK